ncbi:MAG: hypothetical protein ABI761_05020 [Saprospiraceae bacterium]
MKKGLSILLLLVFALNLGGILLVFKIHQFQIRCEIRRHIRSGICTEDMKVISIKPDAAGSLAWEDENEFLFQGMMYDVVRRDTSADGSINYYCISDDQETILFAELEESIRKSNKQENRSQELTKKFFSLFFNLYFEKNTTFFTAADLNACLHWNVFIAYSAPYLNIVSPPPRWLDSI